MARRGNDSDPRKRILVAEDTSFSQRMTVAVIEKLGFEAVAVTSGEQAIEALEEESFDLVLMDVEMSGISGIEATQLIRASTKVRNPKIPILALTAIEDGPEREACLAAGMNDFLNKPIMPNELAQAISQYLPIATRLSS